MGWNPKQRAVRCDGSIHPSIRPSIHPSISLFVYLFRHHNKMEYFFEDVEMMMISTSFFSGSNSSNLLGVVVDICIYIYTYKDIQRDEVYHKLWSVRELCKRNWNTGSCSFSQFSWIIVYTVYYSMLVSLIFISAWGSFPAQTSPLIWSRYSSHHGRRRGRKATPMTCSAMWYMCRYDTDKCVVKIYVHIIIHRRTHIYI